MASGGMLLTFSSLPLPPSPSSSSSSSYSPYYYSLLLSRYPTSFPASSLVSKPPKNGHLSFLLKPSPSPSLPLLSFSSSLRCNATATEYVFPDPIPEFADAEIDKFRAHLVEKLGKKKDLFGDSVQEVAGVCTEILSKFLHTEYGGPGTLLVIPFIDMADTLKERGLPGGPQAARAAVVWAQKHIDKDWKEWTGDSDSD